MSRNVVETAKLKLSWSILLSTPIFDAVACIPGPHMRNFVVSSLFLWLWSQLIRQLYPSYYTPSCYTPLNIELDWGIIFGFERYPAWISSLVGTQFRIYLSNMFFAFWRVKSQNFNMRKDNLLFAGISPIDYLNNQKPHNDQPL